MCGPFLGAGDLCHSYSSSSLMKTNFDICVLIYEKFLLAVTVAIITAALLYLYNVYSKSFEVAESQARSYSIVGGRLRELVITNTVKTMQEVRFAYNESARSLPNKNAEAADSLALELEKTSALLATELPRSAIISKSIARKMRETIVDFETGLNFTNSQIELFEQAIADLQVSFLSTYNSEIAALTISEFRRFKDQFDQEIPIYLRPLSVILISFIFLICSTAFIFWLKGRPKTPLG